MRASAKLIANFDLGNERLSRGAMSMQNSRMKRNPGEKAAAGKAKMDAARHTAPTLITEAFTKFESFSRDIAEASAEMREFIGEHEENGDVCGGALTAKQILTLLITKMPAKD